MSTFFSRTFFVAILTFIVFVPGVFAMGDFDESVYLSMDHPELKMIYHNVTNHSYDGIPLGSTKEQIFAKKGQALIERCDGKKRTVSDRSDADGYLQYIDRRRMEEVHFVLHKNRLVAVIVSFLNPGRLSLPSQMMIAEKIGLPDVDFGEFNYIADGRVYLAGLYVLGKEKDAKRSLFFFLNRQLVGYGVGCLALDECWEAYESLPPIPVRGSKSQSY